MLVNEAVDLLVGDEGEGVVERVAAGIDVLAARDLLQALAHVREELLAGRVPLGVRLGLEVAQVARQRELHVHMQHAPLGQQEGEVGTRGPALDAGVAAVVHTLD